MSGGFGSDVKAQLYADKDHYQRHHIVCNPLGLELVPETSRRVLDIGCCKGEAGRTLKQRQPCEVWGVEISPEFARIAAQHYEQVIVGDIEDDAVWQQLPKGFFDCVICGDVLEHLIDPERVLRRLREVVRPEATLVLSTPHIGHASVVQKLLRGEWDYEPSGLLDSGHLRFFGRKNLWRMLINSGWVVSKSIAQVVPYPIPEEATKGFLKHHWATPVGLSESQICEWFLSARLMPPDIPLGKEPIDGLVSIIVVNWNNLPYLRQCVGSVFANTRPPFELIVVDNGSTDGSRRYLRELVRQHRNVKVVLNERNLGAPGGRNCGLAVAEGDFIVFLDSDTVMTESWLERLLRWMEIDPTIGMVGPISNFASGQQVEVNYRNLKEMHEFARQWHAQHPGTGWETGALISFCVLMRRSVIDAIGGMDTRFGLMMNEDLDHSLRARVAGFRCWLAVDTFVHHYGSRTSGRLGVEKMMDAAFPRFKEKWNLPEEAEKYRPRIMLVPELFDPRRRPPQPKDLYEPLPDPKTLTVIDGKKVKPLISLCLIVKNEADNLPRCLESVQGIVDEIIVVDTGSTDETPQIAERYGAKVIRFEWTGSFSDARNENLRHAKGEWILWLDADEAVAEGKERLRALLEENDGIRPASQDHRPVYDGFILPMVSFVGTRSHREGHVHPAFRLFRNLPGIRFERNLHEQIASSIKRVKPDAKFGVLPVWIEHYGYLLPLVKRKGKVDRNLELAKKDLRANPSDPFAWYNLGREYLRLGQWERAFYCLRRALMHLGDTFTPYLLRCLCDAVSCLIRLNRPRQALALLQESQQLPVTTPDFWMLEGQVRFALGDWEGALRAFQGALSFQHQLPTDFDWTEGATSYGAWYWMGLCHQKMGQLADASRCFGTAIHQALLRRRYYEPAINAFVQLVLPQCASVNDIRRAIEPFVPGDLTERPQLLVLLAKAALGHYPLPPFALAIAEELLTVAAESVKRSNNLLGWDETEERFVQGKLALLQRNYSKAASVFAQVPLTSPEGVTAWNLRVLAHALANEWDDAFVLCGDDELWRWLLKRWQGDAPEEPTIPMEWQVSLRENLCELLMLLLQLQEFERYEQTLPLLDRLVVNEGERAELLGNLYGQFGFWDTALEMLLPFAQDGGLTREGWRTLAKACQHKGLYEEAATILLRLIDSNERKDEALADYMALASCYIAAGKSEQAQQVLDLMEQLIR